MEMKFYRCRRCGKIIAMVKNSACPTMCCQEAMEEIVPGNSDGAVEKHVPVYEVKDNKVFVTVGSIEHPMSEEHYIEWIAVCTNRGNKRTALKPGDAPKAEFALLEGEEVQSVLAYCNLHSLFRG